jgi:hypothetical protein
MRRFRAGLQVSSLNAMYREMDKRFWLEQAEAGMRDSG